MTDFFGTVWGCGRVGEAFGESFHGQLYFILTIVILAEKN